MKPQHMRGKELPTPRRALYRVADTLWLRVLVDRSRTIFGRREFHIPCAEGGEGAWVSVDALKLLDGGP